jgi:3D (Asp-Asp-Asp) domain-containing protein
MKHIKTKKITNDLYYAKQTRWGWIAVGVCIATIIACYIPCIANGAGEGSIDTSGRHGIGWEAVILEQDTVSKNCVQVGEGHWDCSSPEDRAKWTEYLENRVKEYEEEIGRSVRDNSDKVSVQSHGVLYKTVTAYTSRPEETDSTPEIAANGENIMRLWEKGDFTCAGSFQFGTVIWVEGLGNCTIRDRLHPRFSHRIDWHAGGADQLMVALQIGKQKRKVKVLHVPNK